MDRDGPQLQRPPSYTKLATRWQKVHGARDLKTCNQNSTADTGATVTCGGKHLLKGLGLKVTDLIPTNTTLTAANGQPVKIMGVVPVRIHMLKNGISVGEPQLELLHISKTLGKLLLSRSLLINFGSVPASFPYPPNVQPTYRMFKDQNNNEAAAFSNTGKAASIQEHELAQTAGPSTPGIAL